MKKSLFVLAVAALIIVAALVGVAQAQKDNKVIYISSGQATYKPSPMGGVSQQVLAGDPDKGPHATFTKFVPGYDAGMHTHTNDVSIVVIKVKMKPVKNVSGRANTSSSQVATNTGAAATRPKARSFISKGPGSSTLYRRSSETSETSASRVPSLVGARNKAGVAPRHYRSFSARVPPYASGVYPDHVGACGAFPSNFSFLISICVWGLSSF